MEVIVVWEPARDTLGFSVSHSWDVAPAAEWIHSGAQTEEGSKGGVGSRPLYGITGTPHGKTHPELRGISTFPGSQRNGSGAEAGTERGKVLINHLLMSLAWREV